MGQDTDTDEVHWQNYRWEIGRTEMKINLCLIILKANFAAVTFI